MIRKQQCLLLESSAMREVRFVNRLFRIAACYDETRGANCASGPQMQQSPYLRPMGGGQCNRAAASWSNGLPCFPYTTSRDTTRANIGPAAASI
jgi:hypothetical protein